MLVHKNIWLIKKNGISQKERGIYENLIIDANTSEATIYKTTGFNFFFNMWEGRFVSFVFNFFDENTKKDIFQNLGFWGRGGTA